MLTQAILSAILLTSDKQKISYGHYEYGHKSVVIIAHGFFTSKESVLLKKLKDGLSDSYDIIMFDFRGHGRSSGLFSWTTYESHDLKAVIEHAKARYEIIGLIGFSLGAAISINVLPVTQGVDSFVAVSAPSDFDKIEYHFWKLNPEEDIFYNLGEGGKGKGIRPGPFWLKKQKPIEAVDKITVPVLYIHGDKDWVVGCNHSKKLYEKTAAKKKVAIIKNGTHAEYLMRKNAQEVIGLIKDWFIQTLRRH
ncbi:MAG: alpha/beta fold hydrolase [Candidatus Omnitrophota bacterium]